MPSDPFEMACKHVQAYAARAVEDDAYRPLLLVGGSRETLSQHTAHMNGPFPSELCGISLGDPEERVFHLFGYMNPPKRHRDGGMSFDDRGFVADAPVRLIYSEYEGAEEMYEQIRDIKGRGIKGEEEAEIGLRHTAAVCFTHDNPSCWSVVLSERARTVIPFREGKVYDSGIWVPPQPAGGRQLHYPVQAIPEELQSSPLDALFASP